MEYQYFSIVVPAHNEEKYIKNLLNSLLCLEYPKDKFEIIIIENGSDDKTFLEIKKFKSKVIKSYSIKDRGISIAKNFGAKKASKKTKWIIFLDADTQLEKKFLKRINNYLSLNKDKKLVIGTTKVVPIEKKISIKIWFWLYDLEHRLLDMSASIQIVDKKIFNKIKYDVNLRLQEDLDLIKKMKRLGKFFYVSIPIKASARRFEKKGSLKLLFEWGTAGLSPYKLKKKRDYEVIR
jgi:glycosyltransferase involved in cell wall biosynthesis